MPCAQFAGYRASLSRGELGSSQIKKKRETFPFLHSRKSLDLTRDSFPSPPHLSPAMLPHAHGMKSSCMSWRTAKRAAHTCSRLLPCALSHQKVEQPVRISLRTPALCHHRRTKGEGPSCCPHHPFPILSSWELKAIPLTNRDARFVITLNLHMSWA